MFPIHLQLFVKIELIPKVPVVYLFDEKGSFSIVFQYSDIKFGENVESSLLVVANVIFELKIISSHF